MKDDWYQNNVSKSNLRGGGTNFKPESLSKKTAKVIFQKHFNNTNAFNIHESFLWAFTIGREPYLFTKSFLYFQ